MAGELSVRHLEPREYGLWDRFVDESQHGSIYNQSFFLESLGRAIDRQYRIIGAFRNDQLVGGMGFLYTTSRYGDLVSPPPLQYYNGLVIGDFESKYPSVTSSRQARVIRALLDELESGKYALVELSTRSTFDDPRPLLWRGWKIWPRYTFMVSISDIEKQWSRVRQNLRRLISRCENEGMTLEMSDDADAFYSLHQDTYRRKGVEPYVSRERFLTLHSELRQRNAIQIYLARTSEGKLAAGQVVLMSRHPVTHTWMAGSDPSFLRSGASAFLRWKVFQDLSRRNYASNDLTDAMNENVSKFKSQFGGELAPSFVIYKEISSGLRMMKRVTDLLKRPSARLRKLLVRRSIPSSPDE